MKALANARKYVVTIAPAHTIPVHMHPILLPLFRVMWSDGTEKMLENVSNCIVYLSKQRL